MNDSTNRSPRHGATHQTPNSRQKSPGLSISTGSGVNGSPVPRQNGTQGLGLQIGADRAGQANGSPEERRSSVYLPIDDSVSRAGLSVESQAWLFPDHGDHDSNPPKSPSQIHPMYAEPQFSPPKRSSTLPSYVQVESPNAHHKRDDSFPMVDFDPRNQANEENGLRPSRPTPDRKPSRPFYDQDGVSLPLRQSHQSATLFGMSPSLQAKLDKPSAWLVYYFLLNLSLTLYNKLVLVKFPFPWALSVHTLCGAAGASLLLQQGVFVQARLTQRESLTLVAFSVLYTVNIAISNLSLNLVTVPFHQVVRATTPIFTIAISMIVLHKRYSQKTYISLIPVVAGVGFATFGDYSFTALGFSLTILGTLLAALKTIVTNMIQVGRLKLHPLDLLLRMSPLAFVQCVVYSWWTGELSRVREYGATQMTSQRALALLINGCFAFLLNIVSFSANKKTSALTMTVSANVKQVLTIILAVEIFDLTITPLNLLGIVLTLAGGAWYGKIEYDQKVARDKATLLGSSEVKT